MNRRSFFGRSLAALAAAAVPFWPRRTDLPEIVQQEPLPYREVVAHWHGRHIVLVPTGRVCNVPDSNAPAMGRW